MVRVYMCGWVGVGVFVVHVYECVCVLVRICIRVGTFVDACV